MLFLKKLKYFTLWFTIILSFAYVMYPESETFQMSDGSGGYDIRLPLLDQTDIVFERGDDNGEGLEGLHTSLIVLFYILVIIQSLAFIRRLIFSDNRDMSEIKALLISMPLLYIGFTFILYLASFVFIGSFFWGMVISIILSLIYTIFCIGAGIIYAEEDKGIFNVYDSLEKYFDREYDYNENIENLTEQYKTAIR